jgi:SH3-like domain-containing protein
MRGLIAAISLILVTTSAWAADEFPYQALVKKATQVRSGPGKNFYPTDQLEEGAKLEVYRHDPGGWCAIRPPDGSFSWVRSRYLETGSDNLATVSSEDVVARIGSSLSDAKDIIQVHLNKGEPVELVDGDEAEPGPWRKIAPPAGEFRWILLDAIERDDSAKEAEEVVPAGYDDVAEPTIAGGEEESVEERPRRRRLSRAAFHKEIVDIDLELSTRATEDASTWDFEDLKERAEIASAAAPTALDRAQARDLLTKIDRFDQLRGRQDAAQIAAANLVRRGNRWAAQLESTVPAVDTSRYDGVGKLAQITNKQSATPQYALIDSEGVVRYYLNPSPGVNLRAYVNKQVGVNGTRGQVTGRDQQLINTQRITELPSGTIRR